MYKLIYLFLSLLTSIQHSVGNLTDTIAPAAQNHDDIAFKPPEFTKDAPGSGVILFPYHFPGGQYPPPIQHPPGPAKSFLPSEKSFLSLGFIDPLVLIAVVALPLLTLLAFGAIMMPLVPIFIYMLSIFFPAAAGKRKKRQVNLKIPFIENLILKLDKLWKKIS
ncbi:uncharacterized protein LOC128395422 [Panonychus citri]|uniref:uncharacterized protein LOC128395422 n=1 Tax=Panonychus citri TaxID=50023 RepID=UPI0023076B68|nr:uncharacterized protein LOC128395422 [Panonychus citri]